MDENQAGHWPDGVLNIGCDTCWREFTDEMRRVVRRIAEEFHGIGKVSYHVKNAVGLGEEGVGEIQVDVNEHRERWIESWELPD